MADVNAVGTSGNILLADGVCCQSAALSGDVTIDALGVLAISADSVVLKNDTTGNYVQSIADAGNSTITITNGTAEGGAVTLDVVDLNCTNCLNAAEIEDIYILNTGDSLTGELVFYNTATSTSTIEGAVYYDTDDDSLYLYTAAGFVDLTQQNTTYTAGTDLDLTGTVFSLETTLDSVVVINLTESRRNKG